MKKINLCCLFLYVSIFTFANSEADNTILNVEATVKIEEDYLNFSFDIVTIEDFDEVTASVKYLMGTELTLAMEVVQIESRKYTCTGVLPKSAFVSFNSNVLSYRCAAILSQDEGIDPPDPTDEDAKSSINVTSKGFVELISPTTGYYNVNVATLLPAWIDMSSLHSVYTPRNTVGIGTDSPRSALHVTGATLDETPDVAGTQIAQGYMEVTRNGSSPYIDFQNDIGGTDYDARMILTDDDLLSLEGAGLNVNGPLSSNQNGTYIEMGLEGDNGYLDIQGDGSLDFQHEGSTNMSLASSGNLGIGTETPLSKIHIVGGEDIPGGQIQFQRNEGAPRMGIRSYEYNDESDRMLFYTNIESSIYPLELFNTRALFNSNIYSSGFVQASYPEDNENYIRIGHGGDNAYLNKKGAGNMDFRNNDETLMSLTDEGNLNMIQNQRIKLGDAFVSSGSLNEHGPYAHFGNLGWFSDGTWYDRNDNEGLENEGGILQFDGNIASIRIFENEIWNTPLMVRGNELKVTGAPINIIKNNVDDDLMLSFRRLDSSGEEEEVFKWLVGEDGALVLEKMDDNGNYEPELKLYDNIFGVNGEIGAVNEFTLAGNFEELWADYVFDDAYDLMSLSELDNYIKKYHHLPEVPTAQEVQEEGIKFTNVSIIYLKKIEELTLHMIELQKQIDGLKAQISRK